MSIDNEGACLIKVAIVTQPEYFSFIYEDILENENFDFFIYPFKFSYTELDFEPLINFNANVNIFFRGEFIPNLVLDRLTGINVALSSEPFPCQNNNKLYYTSDSLLRLNSFRNIKFRNYDYVFHYDETSGIILEKDGFKLSGFFTFPVSTNIYRKVDVEKKWDFFFIGRSTNFRETFLGSLKHKYNFLHIAHGVWGPELVQYANQSKILLNIHAENEISWEPRVQMLMATGNMLISNKLSLNDCLIPGEDYIVANSPKELKQLSEYYLSNDKEREKIAANGKQKIITKLNSEQKFIELINDIIDRKFKKTEFFSNNIYYSILIQKTKVKNKLLKILQNYL